MALHRPISPSRLGQPLTFRGRKGSFQREATAAIFGSEPPAVVLPFISGQQRVGRTLSVVTLGLTGITGQEWFQDDLSQSTAETFSPTQAMVPVFCRITHDGGVSDTPAVWIYMDHASGQHNQDDDSILALVPHTTRTVTAIADGSFRDPTIWNTGTVPTTADRVLIPQGRDVTYDVPASPRLWDIRLDGTLRWSMTESTHLLVETIVVTVTGAMIIGNSVSDRVPENVRHEIVISDRSFALDPTGSTPTVMDIANDPGLFGRGILCQGLRRTFGHFFTPALFCADGTWPMAGDTTLTLKEAPIDWRVGKDIRICGMRYEIDGFLFKDETELRTITEINGAQITFEPPLEFDHDDRIDRTTYPDAESFTVPAVSYQDRNIIFRSEAPHRDQPWLRGHIMVAHELAVQDGWAHMTSEMGRTDKTKNAGKIDPLNDQFRFVDWEGTGSGTQNQLVHTAPFPEMNLISRYAEHMHFLGFERGNETATLRECLIIGVIGWGMVQHSCQAKVFDNVINDFANGMISETGNELDAWADNWVFGCTNDYARSGSIKFTEGPPSVRGDKFRVGVCYGFSGRGMRVVRNFAGSAPAAYMFFHRSGGSDPTDNINGTISPNFSLDRKYLDFGVISELNWNDGILQVNDYPIRHFNRNIAAATGETFGVTKASPAQATDIGINLRNFRAYAVTQGPRQEYVATYNWVRPYVQATDPNPSGKIKTGLASGGAAFQITYLEPKLVGDFDRHLRVFAGGLYALPEDFNNTNNPMASILGAITSFPLEVTYNLPEVEPATRIGPTPAFSKPVISGPLVAYYWNGDTSQGCLSAIASHTRDDSLGSQTLPKPWDTVGLRTGVFTSNGSGDVDNTFQTGALLRTHATRKGYWTWDDNGTIRDILRIRLEHSDRLDGYTINHEYLVVCEGSVWEGIKGNYANNGTFTPTTTQPARADIQTTCPKDGSITLDILTAATSEAGTTIDYLREDFDGTVKVQHLKPDHGDLIVNPDNTVTYIPDPRYVSEAPYTGAAVDPDIFYMFLYDGRSGYETVRVEVTVS